MNSVETVLVGLGSNQGDRLRVLREAVKRIDSLPLTRVVEVSSLFESEPWGKTDQPRFLNAAAKLETSLEPMELLRALNQIEEELGRVRGERWGPRTVDLDILLYGPREIDHPRLKVPHLYLRHRAFVLVPLAELVPDWQLADGQTISRLKEQLKFSDLRLISAPDQWYNLSESSNLEPEGI